MNTFIGRDPALSVDANWPRFLEVWKPLIGHAEARGVKVAIENCPMLFSADEWPGGKNLATTPAIWRRMFREIPSPNFGLNFDPSHLDLATGRLRFAAGRIQGPDLSRPRQRRPDRTERAQRTRAAVISRSSGILPRFPAWATSAGERSSAH